MEQKRYGTVNGAWPQPLPNLTGPEAVTAARRLYRLGLGKTFGGLVKLTSGNRNTWVRYGVMSVNPEKGWRDLVHSLSHYAHARIYPNKQAHNPLHEVMEQRMVDYVIEHGWLDGKLKRAEKPAKPKPAVADVRYARVLAGIERWERKAKRAETALAKLQRQKRYYERKQATGEAP